MAVPAFAHAARGRPLALARSQSTPRCSRSADTLPPAPSLSLALRARSPASLKVGWESGRAQRRGVAFGYRVPPPRAASAIQALVLQAPAPRAPFGLCPRVSGFPRGRDVSFAAPCKPRASLPLAGLSLRCARLLAASCAPRCASGGLVGLGGPRAPLLGSPRFATLAPRHGGRGSGDRCRPAAAFSFGCRAGASMRAGRVAPAVSRAGVATASGCAPCGRGSRTVHTPRIRNPNRAPLPRPRYARPRPRFRPLRSRSAPFLMSRAFHHNRLRYQPPRPTPAGLIYDETFPFDIKNGVMRP